MYNVVEDGVLRLGYRLMLSYVDSPNIRYYLTVRIVYCDVYRVALLCNVIHSPMCDFLKQFTHICRRCENENDVFYEMIQDCSVGLDDSVLLFVWNLGKKFVSIYYES